MKSKFKIGDKVFYFETYVPFLKKKKKGKDGKEVEYTILGEPELSAIIPIEIASIIFRKEGVEYYSKRTGHCTKEEKLCSAREAKKKLSDYINHKPDVESTESIIESE